MNVDTFWLLLLLVISLNHIVITLVIRLLFAPGSPPPLLLRESPPGGQSDALLLMSFSCYTEMSFLIRCVHADPARGSRAEPVPRLVQREDPTLPTTPDV